VIPVGRRAVAVAVVVAMLLAGIVGFVWWRGRHVSEDTSGCVQRVVEPITVDGAKLFSWLSFEPLDVWRGDAPNLPLRDIRVTETATGIRVWIPVVTSPFRRWSEVVHSSAVLTVADDGDLQLVFTASRGEVTGNLGIEPPEENCFYSWTRARFTPDGKYFYFNYHYGASVVSNPVKLALYRVNESRSSATKVCGTLVGYWPFSVGPSGELFVQQDGVVAYTNILLTATQGAVLPVAKPTVAILKPGGVVRSYSFSGPIVTAIRTGDRVEDVLFIKAPTAVFTPPNDPRGVALIPGTGDDALARELGKDGPEKMQRFPVVFRLTDNGPRFVSFIPHLPPMLTQAGYTASGRIVGGFSLPLYSGVAMIRIRPTGSVASHLPEGARLYLVGIPHSTDYWAGQDGVGRYEWHLAVWLAGFPWFKDLGVVQMPDTADLPPSLLKAVAIAGELPWDEKTGRIGRVEHEAGDFFSKPVNDFALGPAIPTAILTDRYLILPYPDVTTDPHTAIPGVLVVPVDVARYLEGIPVPFTTDGVRLHVAIGLGEEKATFEWEAFSGTQAMIATASVDPHLLYDYALPQFKYKVYPLFYAPATGTVQVHGMGLRTPDAGQSATTLVVVHIKSIGFMPGGAVTILADAMGANPQVVSISAGKGWKVEKATCYAVRQSIVPPELGFTDNRYFYGWRRRVEDGEADLRLGFAVPRSRTGGYEVVADGFKTVCDVYLIFSGEGK